MIEDSQSGDYANLQKSSWQCLLDFCALSPSQLAEYPLKLFFVCNGWFEGIFKWLSEGDWTEWVSDFNHDHPKIYWGTAIIWIPLAIVVGFYVLDLFFICGIACVAFVIATTVTFVVVCKSIHIVNLLFHPYKKQSMK